MKRIFQFTIISFSIATFLSSCEKGVLEQQSPSTFDSETVFSNFSLAKSAIDGIMASMLDNSCYPLRYQCFYGANTDIEINIDYNKTNNGIQTYQAYPEHERLNGASECFSLLYQGVERANLAIDGLKKWGDIEHNENMKILYAQALTLRAHIYCDLTRAWGDVPARFVPVSQDLLYKPKENRDVIFKHILDDLDEAIPVLPYPGEHELTSNAYHINKMYAAGLFARVALMASGYAQRPDDDKIGTGDPGTVRLSSDPDLNKQVLYPRALKHLENVIQADKMTLAKDYREYWRKFNNCELGENPKEETVLVLPFNNQGRWNYTFAVRVDNGVMNGYTVSHVPYTGPSPCLYFDFNSEDKRRNVTCFNNIEKGTCATTSVISHWFFGKFRIDQMKDRPYTGTNNDSVKPVAMRYSDLLLMAAEIENELGHLDLAKNYYKPVRARAFDEAKADQFLAGLNSKEAFFNAIVDERAFEFCGEHIRKADLIRWNMLKSKMDETKEKLYELRDRAGRYSYVARDIWSRPNPDDPWELQIYGYEPGENGTPEGEGWVKRNNHFTNYNDSDLTSTTMLTVTKIESIYAVDPDTRQFWPIPANAITNSQGVVVNDYGY